MTTNNNIKNNNGKVEHYNPSYLYQRKNPSTNNIKTNNGKVGPYNSSYLYQGKISKLIIVKLDPITLPIYTKGNFQALSQMLVDNGMQDISFISMSFLSNEFKSYIQVVYNEMMPCKICSIYILFLLTL